MSAYFSLFLAKRTLVVAFVLGLSVGWCLLLKSTSADDPKSGPDGQMPADIYPLTAAGLDPRTGERRRIPGGDLQSAMNYYQKELSQQLTFPGKKMPDNLDKLLGYFGYQVLRAIDLDELPPSILMGNKETLEVELRNRWKILSGDDFPKENELTKAKVWEEQKEILAARYFSPKTSDVSGLSGKLSWRKVVRLKPRPKSDAEGDGLAALYFLSVLYVDDLKKNPFANRSLNVQVILTRDPNNKKAKLKDPLCWMVFDPAQNYALGYYTKTSWDAADPKQIEDHGVRPYYVPNACVHCHGGEQTLGVPQFFDTDYILDRTTPGDDFELSLGQSPWGGVFDAGRNPYTNQFRQGFAVFWKLNKEIRDHTLAVDTEQEVPSTVGVRNWLRLHGEKDLTSVLHVPPIQRGIPVGFKKEGDPALAWSEKDPVDFQLLPLLNRYCYRCHSGLIYNVFDKQAVKDRATTMIKKLRSTDPKKWMPQDRRLSYSEKEQLIELLGSLKQQKGAE